MQTESLMNPDVLAFPEEMTVAEAARLLQEHRMTGAPVVDRGGNPVGVVSQTDLLEAYATQGSERHWIYYRSGSEGLLRIPDDEPSAAAGRRSVREVMMPVVFTVPRDSPVERAAKLMHQEHIHRVLVVDGRRLVGVLTASDVVRAVALGWLR